MNAHILKICLQKFLIFVKFLKIQEKIKNPQIFIMFLFHIVQREDAHR